MLKSDLSMAGNAAITERDASSPNLEWDAESEAAWCPMIGHTYLRNVQGLCTVLPRIKIDRTGYCDEFMTAVARVSDQVKCPNTFIFRYIVDENGIEIKGASDVELD